ncbi:MAG: hypothetical protein Q4B99_06205, partial [Clostridia bacterium]|nr:hypothetical protein [Clostridia bacterium]
MKKLISAMCMTIALLICVSACAPATQVEQTPPPAPLTTPPSGDPLAAQKTTEPPREVLEVMPIPRSGTDGYEEAHAEFVERQREGTAHFENAVAAFLADGSVAELVPPLYSYESAMLLEWEDDEDYLQKRHNLIGLDNCYNLFDNPMGCIATSGTLVHMPQGAVRLIPDGDYGYLMYDLDNGMRMFFFFGADGLKEGVAFSGSVRLGVTVIMGDKLSYSDYADMAVGDELSTL